MTESVALTGFDGSAIQGIKTLRAVAAGSLRWAKNDVYDVVKLGGIVSIDVLAGSVETLREAGWTVVGGTVTGVISRTVTVPAQHFDTLRRLVNALDGQLS